MRLDRETKIIIKAIVMHSTSSLTDCGIRLFLLATFFFLWGSTLLGGTNSFFVFSPPKCGTHLIAKALTLLTKKKAHSHLGELGSLPAVVNKIHEANQADGFMVAHNFSEEAIHALVNSGYKCIFILRDPRDNIVSVQRWMREGQWQWLRVARMKDPHEQLDELITGNRFGWKCYENCIKRRHTIATMLDKEDCLIVRFEDLVGVKGGGTALRQLSSLRAISAFLNIDISREKRAEIAANLFGSSPTFRSGVVGQWKKEFKPSQTATFLKQYRQELLKLGYES